MKCLEYSLLDSNLEALLVGPKIGSPNELNKSTIPIERGTSGPTTVKQLLFFAYSANPSISFGDIDIFSLVPPFPLAYMTFWTCSF